jgi:hypothetical protein
MRVTDAGLRLRAHESEKKFIIGRAATNAVLSQG